MVLCKYLDYVGVLGGFGCGYRFEIILYCGFIIFGAFQFAYYYVETRIPQIQRLATALYSVSYNRDFFIFYRIDIRVFVVINPRHLIFPPSPRPESLLSPCGLFRLCQTAAIVPSFCLSSSYRLSPRQSRSVSPCR